MIVYFEGLDGSGKSTVSKAVAKVLSDGYGLTVCHSRAPGGTPAAEKIRASMMGTEKMQANTVLLLMSAAANEQRHYIVEQEAKNDVVILDRWWFSTYAYQHAMGADSKLIRTLVEKVMFFPYYPSMAFFFDASAEEREQRMYERGGAKDRFESFPHHVRAETAERYSRLVDQEYLTRVDANRTLTGVVDDIVRRVLKHVVKDVFGLVRAERLMATSDSLWV